MTTDKKFMQQCDDVKIIAEELAKTAQPVLIALPDVPGKAKSLLALVLINGSRYEVSVTGPVPDCSHPDHRGGA